MTPEFLIDPYPTYRELREGDRVHRVDFYGGAWLVACYDDVVQALRDERFRNGKVDMLMRQFGEREQDELADFRRIFGAWMLATDAPLHARLRSISNRAFSVNALERRRGGLRALARRLAAAIPEDEPVDFVERFAEPLPALVLVEMLGVDAEDRSRFLEWTDDVAGFFGAPVPSLARARSAQASIVAMTEYFRGALAERRREPGPDLLSALLSESRGKAPDLPEDVILAQCSMFMGAGIETTSNFLSIGLLTLMRHPGELERLRENPRIMKQACRELVRFDSPLQFTTRVASCDLDLLGTRLREGDLMVAALGAANRDPSQFTRPEALDLTRSEAAPLSFSAGPHVCIGSGLAYLEAEEALRALFERFDRIEPAGEVSWGDNPRFRGIRRLPLRFSARPA